MLDKRKRRKRKTVDEPLVLMGWRRRKRKTADELVWAFGFGNWRKTVEVWPEIVEVDALLEAVDRRTSSLFPLIPWARKGCSMGNKESGDSLNLKMGIFQLSITSWQKK